MAKGKDKPSKQTKKPKSDKPKGAGFAYDRRAAKRANFRNFRPALSCGIVKVFLGEADLLSFMSGSCGTSHRAVTGLHLRDRRPVRELSAFRLSGNFSTMSSVVVRRHFRRRRKCLMTTKTA
jgi:hypothetical protein